MGSDGDDESQKGNFYDVDKFKAIVDAQASMTPPSGFGLFLVRLRSGIDSVGGLIATFAGMLTVFAAPLIVIIGALFGLVGFLLSSVGVIGFLALYVQRKLGTSMQVDSSNIGKKVLGQVLGCALVLAVFYLIFFVFLHLKLS